MSAPCRVHARGADLGGHHGFLHSKEPQADNADSLRAGVQPHRPELRGKSAVFGRAEGHAAKDRGGLWIHRAPDDSAAFPENPPS